MERKEHLDAILPLMRFLLKYLVQIQRLSFMT